jgi:hypothetical protein
MKTKEKAVSGREYTRDTRAPGKQRIKNAYTEINKIKTGFKPRTDFCRNKEGYLITNKEGIKNRWKEYFQDLLSQSPGQETDTTEIQNTSTQTEEEVEPPALEGVRIAVQSLKNNKVPGVDRIPAEICKIGGPSLDARVHSLWMTIWMKETIPKDWAISMICPIYKKGTRHNVAIIEVYHCSVRHIKSSQQYC